MSDKTINYPPNRRKPEPSDRTVNFPPSRHELPSASLKAFEEKPVDFPQRQKREPEGAL